MPYWVRVSLLIGCLGLTVAGCSRARLDSNGKPRPPQQKLECGVQTILTVFEDQNNDEVFGPQEMIGAALSFTSGLTAVQNYNYNNGNYSGHPIVGPPGEDKTLSAFFYSGPEGLSFNFFFDQESDAIRYLTHIRVIVTQNKKRDGLLLSDEPGELWNKDAKKDATFYLSEFDNRMSTDGGVIGPLVGGDFEVLFQLESPGYVRKMKVHSAHGGITEVAKLDFMVKYANVDPCIFKN